MGGVTTYYLYDGDELIDEETTADASNPVVSAYGWGVDGLRVRYAFAANPTADLPAESSLAYLYDPSGNVCERLELLYNNDTTGQPDGQGLYVQVRDYQVYDAFGALSGRMDTDTYPMVAMDLDPVGFGGQFGYYTDTETGLVLLGARYYDPSTGRFLNRDPIGYDGGINLYGFCGNNPVNESDPRGTDALDNAQLALTGLGFIPGLGEVADVASAGVSLAQGDYAGAALSAAGAIPVFGDAALLAKLAKTAEKIAREKKEARAALAVANRLAGGVGEVTVKRQLEQAGHRVIASQVYVRLENGAIRKIDHLVRLNTGKVAAVEVKVGNAVRSTVQRANDVLLEYRGGKVYGNQAQKVINELGTNKVKVPTIIMRDVAPLRGLF